MFKKGDIVKIVRGYYGSINDPDVGKICMVSDIWVDDDGNTRYKLIENKDTGVISYWWRENRLELMFGRD